MALRLQIVSRHRQNLRERSIKEFGQNGGTIGRSLESDWVLPDGQRFLSSRHASIDFRSGSYYIIDTSTNGVYINGSNQAVGRGNPQRLFPGDRVRMGDYEMLVHIDEVDSTREQLSDSPHVDPVDLKQRVEAPEVTTYDLIDPFEVTGVGIESLLDEDQASTLAPLDYEFQSEELSLEPEPSRPSAPPAAATAAPPAARSGQSTRVKVKREKTSNRTIAPQAAAPTSALPPLNAFFRGAGLQPQALDEQQTEATLLRLGQLMREMIAGLAENLHIRAAQKTLLRQSNTTIQPRDNNPLKFSAGVDETLGNLLFRESEQYVDAVEAVREAFGDIKRHQQALMKSMLSAVADYIGRLEPEQLEQKFSDGRQGLLKGATNKLKYWDLYKDLYQVVAQQSPGELPLVFLEEISRAYELETTRQTGARPEQKIKASVG
jgi:type VI secretion system protein